jgi:beta-glucosidase
MTWKLALAAGAAVCALALSAAGQTAQAQSADSFSPRVQALLKQLTLDEKLALTQGVVDPVEGKQAGFTRGVDRLGIPPLRWVDGPGGVDNRYDATSLPQPIALAATFNRRLAYDYGVIEGKDTRATHMDVFLGPMVNIARLPNWGRNATASGEDPFLIGELVGPQIKGIQDQGVIASTKHFVAYNQAFGVDSEGHQKIGNNFVVDPRTLHEIYLPGFEAAVKAGTGSIMAAYSAVNGYPNAGNPDTLIGILRGELGFKGLVESDWGANKSSDAVAKGLDVEFSGGGATANRANYFGPALKAEIAAGRVPQTALDQAVGHVLTTMDQFGMLNHTRAPGPDHLDIPGDAAVALKVAEQSAVLLKNEGVLPLSEKALGSLVMIGPTAGQLVANPGFGSALGLDERKVSPFDAMRRTAGPGARVSYARGQDLTGEPIPASVLTPEGMTGSGFTRSPGDGSPQTVDATLDFTGARALPFARAYVWKAVLKPPVTGDYVLMTQSWGGGAQLKIDGEIKARSAISQFSGPPKKTSSLLPTVDGLDNGRVQLRLEAGKTYRIELAAQGWADQPMQVRLNWVTPQMRQREIDNAVAAARASDTAVVLAWQRAGEQSDPEKNLLLPEDQNELIAAVAAANPNTVVVLTSGPVQMPWLNKVRAVMEVWFAGQEGGLATAEILTGKVNPSGKLPITFPARSEDTPALAPGHPERYAGLDGKTVYSEGVMVGYRWYDQNKIAPLFPFGHGLSYTTFRYSGLTTKAGGDGVDVGFALSNTGKTAGAEVPQIYVGPPARQPVPMAPRQLSGFERVELAPGESRVVKVHIPRRQLSYWSVEAKGWRVATGRRLIFVGSSSRDTRLSGSIEVADH